MEFSNNTYPLSNWTFCIRLYRHWLWLHVQYTNMLWLIIAINPYFIIIRMSIWHGEPLQLYLHVPCHYSNYSLRNIVVFQSFCCYSILSQQHKIFNSNAEGLFVVAVFIYLLQMQNIPWRLNCILSSLYSAIKPQYSTCLTVIMVTLIMIRITSFTIFCLHAHQCNHSNIITSLK